MVRANKITLSGMQKMIDMNIYEENRQTLLMKTATCAEHGTFSDVGWSDAALYGRLAEFRNGETGVDNLMPRDMLDTWGRARAGQ